MQNRSFLCCHPQTFFLAFSIWPDLTHKKSNIKTTDIPVNFDCAQRQLLRFSLINLRSSFHRVGQEQKVTHGENTMAEVVTCDSHGPEGFSSYGHSCHPHWQQDQKLSWPQPSVNSRIAPLCTQARDTPNLVCMDKWLIGRGKKKKSQKHRKQETETKCGPVLFCFRSNDTHTVFEPQNLCFLSD